MTKFTAEKCNFQEEPGYMVKQYKDKEVVCEQFIANDAFAGYQAYVLAEGYDMEIIPESPDRKKPLIEGLIKRLATYDGQIEFTEEELREVNAITDLLDCLDPKGDFIKGASAGISLGINHGTEQKISEDTSKALFRAEAKQTTTMMVAAIQTGVNMLKIIKKKGTTDNNKCGNSPSTQD